MYRPRQPIAILLICIALLTGVATWLAIHRTVRIDAAIKRQEPGMAVGDRLLLPDMRVDLNTASAAQLTQLPAIGPALAERIIEDRQSRRFESVDDLDRVSGIGPAIIARIRPYVVAE